MDNYCGQLQRRFFKSLLNAMLSVVTQCKRALRDIYTAPLRRALEPFKQFISRKFINFALIKGELLIRTIEQMCSPKFQRSKSRQHLLVKVYPKTLS